MRREHQHTNCELKVPTSHVGVEIGNPVGLHYHYGTLGQLQHGLNYAEAYLRNLCKAERRERRLADWPYADGASIDLYVLAGHRNMEGERAFTQELDEMPEARALLRDRNDIAFKYSLGGGYRVSDGWEPLGPTGYYDTFGPELSFGATLSKSSSRKFAIAKFTHSGSQIIDWTPKGSMAKDRNLYRKFLAFVRESVAELQKKGHTVRLAGICYHVGENDMSFHPFRKQAPERIQALIDQSRVDLKLPKLRWFVSQQPPTDKENLNKLDVTTGIAAVAAEDPHTEHLRVFDLPGREQRLVVRTPGIVRLGQLLAEACARAVRAR